MEPLEERLLLSVNPPWDGYGAGAAQTPGPLDVAQQESSEWEVAALSEAGAEGEDSPPADLVGFAQALAATEDVKLFGSAWCGPCTAQKELFEDGARFLPFIEVTNPDRTPNEIAEAEGITSYPTWEFPDGSREEGMLSLETIASRADVSIPTSTTPFVAPIEDQTVLDGSPLHVGLDGYDPNGGALTFTVTSSDPSVVQPTVLSGNRSASIRFTDWGEMVVELFEQRVPRAAGRFIELAESGFYDAANNDPDMMAHRVIADFMFQFGDPTGTGSGGSDLEDFDDQFHPDLQHNTPGILSWAKASDDTNNSQVFVTDVPTRYLDFNHSVFGILTEGDKVRDAITQTATDENENENDRPVNPVKLDSVSVFEDTENGVVMLEAVEGATGSATITVTVSDENDNSYEETFDVTVEPDTFNGAPYLEDIPPVSTVMDQAAVFQLSSIDVEGDPVVYGGTQAGPVDYTIDVDSQTGDVTVTPPAGYVGKMDVLVYVLAADTADPPDTTDPYDIQRVPLTVAPDAPETVSLSAASDSGISDADNITNMTDLEFQVDGVQDGATVQLYQGETMVGEATAEGTSVTISTSSLGAEGDGIYEVRAAQVVEGLQSTASPTLEVTLDTTAPAEFTSTPPQAAVVGELFSSDAENPEEGAPGTRYSLIGAPAGMSVDEMTGSVNWTPEADDVGSHPFSVIITDAAGNSRSQDVEIEVDSPPWIAFRIETTDADGSPVSSLAVGDEFELRVYVEDVSPDPRGVFSAFIDLVYDETLVMVDGALEYGSDYPTARHGDLETPGLLDEVGAIAGIEELGGGEFLLFGLPMQAIHAGTAVLESEPADELPAHELLTYGGGFDIEPEQVTYGSTSLTITPAFGANDDIFNVDEDSGATSLDVLANDEAFEGSTGAFTIVDVTEPSDAGTATITSDGQHIEYVPADDFFGEETFAYTVSDGTGTDTAVATVQVMSQNDNPTARDDEVVVMEDAVDFVIDVLDNDSIAPDENETLSIVGFDSLSAGGSLRIADGGDLLLYSPAPDYFGIETFDYTIDDGNGGTDTATVTVTIVEENDPPEAVDDSFEVLEDSADNSLDVLANDTTAGDPDESLTIVGVSNPEQGGTVTISQDELTLVYTPEADFFGEEQFTYEITDGNGGFAEATVTVTVSGVNDPPTALDDTFTVVKGETDILLSVLDNDTSEPDGIEELTVGGVDAISGDGTVTVATDGQGIYYSPAPNFTGDETFSYTIEDPEGATSQATVTVTVLDYVPSTLSGHVYLDVDNDGVKNSTETPLGGVIVTLQGTDMFGDPVERQRTTDALGYYQFRDVVPGSYEVIQTQPRFLIDGIDRAAADGPLFSESGTDTLPIELEQDTDVTGFDFGERGLEPSRMTIVDLFASSRENDSVLVAANASDNSHWYAIERGWPDTESLDIDLHEGLSHARLDLTTMDGHQYSATLDLTSRSHARLLGNDGDVHLWRVFASHDQLFDRDEGDPPETGEGGSENDTGGSTGDGEAEGEKEQDAGIVVAAAVPEGEAPLPAGTSELNTPRAAEPESGLLRPPLTTPTLWPEAPPPDEAQAGAGDSASSTPPNPHSAIDLLMAEPRELFGPAQAADQMPPFISAGASSSEENDSYETAIDLLLGESEELDLLAN